MSNGELMPLPVFWARNGLCKTQFYYLGRLRRGPRVTYVGTKGMVAPEAEAEWRREMEANPIRGGLRKLVLVAEAERAESSAA
jgi:hypothetical protein